MDNPLTLNIESSRTVPDTVSFDMNKLKDNIRRFVLSYHLDDCIWAESISSQYFLLCLAKQLNMRSESRHNLINKSLSCYCITYNGDFNLIEDKVLITPKETEKIVACMKSEDTKKRYPESMLGINIDAQQMYLNFHYGLLIRIVGSEDNDAMRLFLFNSLRKLIADSALDTSGGWYPYRVPWITARVLISLKDIDYSSFEEKSKLDQIVLESITSLYNRLEDNGLFWESGVGLWVSKWEATALCLEALMVWDAIEENKLKITEIVKCLKKRKSEWLMENIDFFSEENTNDILASVLMTSVLLRITKTYYVEVFNELQGELYSYLQNVFEAVKKKKYEIKGQQYCTLPQILHYILSAIML